MWCPRVVLLCDLCHFREKGKKRKGRDKDTPSSPNEEVEEDQFGEFKDLPPVRTDVGLEVHACSIHCLT